MIENPDTQVASCCRAIVRLVIREGMAAGDKLPPQDELRQLLNFSHNSLTPAMNSLVEAGMIERKPRRGTLIRDPGSVPKGLWRVALPFGLLDNSPGCQYETVLLRSLQENCLRHGCHIRYYVLNVDKSGAIPHPLSDFGMLQNDVESGHVDGIITPAFFARNASGVSAGFGVPLCHVGGWKETPIQVCLDSEALIVRGLEQLRSRGCQRIAVIFNHTTQKSLRNFIDSHVDWQSLELELVDMAGIGTVADLAAQLAGGATCSIDGVIVMNDILALELVSRLNESGCHPHVVVQSNKQISLFFAYPVIKLEFDIEELAKTGVEMLMDKMARVDMAGCVKTIRPVDKA